MGELSAIVTPLTYRDLLGSKCGEPNMAVKTAFLSDLKAAGAPDALIAEATAEVERIEAAERDTPNEYVCTADLYETTEKNAAAAQKAWAALKNRTS
jgi:thiamine monophosphate synthase